MRSLLLFLLLPSLLLSAKNPDWDITDDKNKPERFRTKQPYTLCPVGSLIDWRTTRVASLAHVSTSTTNETEFPKAYEKPFATVEYGRTCVMTLGFASRESRPILAHVGTRIPSQFDTTVTGKYRLTREPRRSPFSGQVPDMAVFYSEGEKERFGNCDLFKNVQHIQFNSPAGFYFIVCYGSLERLVNADTKKWIGKAGDRVMEEFTKTEGGNIKSQKWNCKKQDLSFIEATRVQKRLKHVLNQQFETNHLQRPHYWVNPTEFEGWSETVMPHVDLRAVIYESYYKKVRTEADKRNTSRFVFTTILNIAQCILMEKFFTLLRKFLL